MTRFIAWCLVLAALIVGGLHLGVNKGLFPMPEYPYTIISFILFWTTLMGGFLLKKLSGPPIDFTRLYLLLMTIRMLLFAGFILVIIWIDNEGAPANAACFMIVYMLFTVLEVGYLFFQVQRNSQEGRPQKDR